VGEWEGARQTSHGDIYASAWAGTARVANLPRPISPLERLSRCTRLGDGRFSVSNSVEGALRLTAVEFSCERLRFEVGRSKSRSKSSGALRFEAGRSKPRSNSIMTLLLLVLGQRKDFEWRWRRCQRVGLSLGSASDPGQGKWNGVTYVESLPSSASQPSSNMVLFGPTTGVMIMACMYTYMCANRNVKSKGRCVWKCWLEGL